MWRAGATLHRGARASHYRGLSCCRAQAPEAQAQQLWLTGLAAPRHVGSSQTRARTRVTCTGRQILNYCATREARIFLKLYSWPVLDQGNSQGCGPACLGLSLLKVCAFLNGALGKLIPLYSVLLSVRRDDDNNGT